MKKLILGLALLCAACSQGRINQNPPQLVTEAKVAADVLAQYNKECPKLSKLWRDDNNKQVTFSRGDNGTGFITVYDKSVGEMSFIIDGRLHPIDEVNNYIGTCSDGVVQVGFRNGKTPMAVLYGLNKAGNIVRVITKFRTIVEVKKLTPLQGRIELPAEESTEESPVGEKL